jgi:anti-anti-sigma factor
MRSASSNRWLEVEQVGEVLVVRIVRAALVEEPAIQHVGHDLARLLDQLGYQRVLIDLGAVERMSSAMFGHLIALWRKAQGVGGRLVLCGTRPEVAEALAILRLTDLIPTYAKQQDALLSF